MKLYEKIIWLLIGTTIGLLVLLSIIATEYYFTTFLLSVFILLLSVRFLKDKEYKLFSFVTFVVVWLLIVAIDENQGWVYFVIILPISWITMRLFHIKFHFGILFLILNPLTLFIGYNLGFLAIREVTCGPSEKVTIPIIQSIENHIEKYGLSKDMKQIDNFPYVLNCEEEVVLNNPNATKGYIFNQTCYFNDGKSKYAIKSSITTTTTTSIQILYIRIRKVDTEKYDMSEKYYFTQYDTEKKTLHKDINLNSKLLYGKSKGKCSRWYPFGRIWGH
jgi:hypothetical protein